MKTRAWLALVLVLFLAGCAPGAYPRYEPAPYEAPTRKDWYLYDGIPPLPVSPEVLGSRPGNHDPAMRQWFDPWCVNPYQTG